MFPWKIFENVHAVMAIMIKNNNNPTAYVLFSMAIEQEKFK